MVDRSGMRGDLVEACSWRITHLFAPRDEVILVNPKVYLCSCLTSLLISPVVFTAAFFAEFSFAIFIGIISIIPIFVAGILAASINELLYAKIKHKYLYIFLESIVILLISIMGSVITLGVISEWRLLDGFFPDGFIFIGYGYLCALIYQISTHVYVGWLSKGGVPD